MQWIRNIWQSGRRSDAGRCSNTWSLARCEGRQARYCSGGCSTHTHTHTHTHISYVRLQRPRSCFARKSLALERHVTAPTPPGKSKFGAVARWFRCCFPIVERVWHSSLLCVRRASNVEAFECRRSIEVQLLQLQEVFFERISFNRGLEFVERF